MATREVLSGARAIFMLQGKKVGHATGVSVRESIQYEPVLVLDNIEVDSHEPVGYEVSLSADFVRIVGESVKQAGYFPKQGKTPADFLSNILTSGEMTAAIQDRKTGEIVYQVEAVKMSERSVSITARGVVGESVTMVAKRIRDEADLT